MNPRVIALCIYPVKGMRAVCVKEANVCETGFENDRRFMVASETGKFVTQRGDSSLATLMAEIMPRGLWIHQLTKDPFPFLPRVTWEQGEKVTVQVWKDQVMAVDQGDAIARRLSLALDRAVRLVYLPTDSKRESRQQITEMNDRVSGLHIKVINSFADAFPFLLTSMASLRDLNKLLLSRGTQEVHMNRFRANIIIDGKLPAYDEESWSWLRIGGVFFRNMKRCGRCVVTTIDQDSGIRAQDNEPFETLKAHRKFGDEGCFGINLNHYGTGVIQEGDEVEILERQGPFIDS